MENNKSENKNKYALVTGATSGIGYELAKQAAQNGFNVILVGRDEGELQKAKADFERYSVEVTTLAKDLFEENAAKEIFDHTRSMGISVSILINDAGQGQLGKFAEVDLERHLEIIRLNITSLVSLTHYFLKDMIARNEGRILEVGSEVSKMPMPLMGVYGATKAFVLSLTEAIVNELKDTEVTMTLLMPGATDTDFFDKADAERTKVYQEKELESPEDVAKAGFEGLLEGKRRVIASNAKLNVAMASVTPDNLNAQNLRKQMEPAEKNKKGRSEPEHEPSRRQ